MTIEQFLRLYQCLVNSFGYIRPLPHLYDMELTSTSLEAFYQLLNKATPTPWTEKTVEKQFAQLVQQGQALCTALLQEGDARAQSFQEAGASPPLNDYLFFYEWLEVGKQFLILWRNTTFGHLQAQLLLTDSLLSEEGFTQWQSDAATQMTGAAQAFADYLPRRIKELSLNPNSSNKQLEAWGHEALPWPVYQEQLRTLNTQLGNLNENQHVLSRDSKQLHELREIIFQNIHNGLDELSQLQALAQEAINYISENFDEHQGRIPIFLENQEHSLPRTNFGKVFNKQLEKGLEGLSGEMLVPVAINGAAIQVKEIDFRRYISRWLDSEVLPLLYEIWEVSTNIRNNLKMALINIRNRAILLNNETSETGERGHLTDDLAQPLHSFLLQTKDRKEGLEEIHQLIHQRMDANFKLSSVFREREFFLSVPLQSTINQFRNNQNELLTQLQKWWYRQRRRIQRWLTDVQTEEAMSLSEKVVRFIETRQVSPNNQAYTSIFLTSGYIGESFWVGRKAELHRVKKVVKSWKQGYRGAILLTGDRFCGKSLFGDLVSNRHFPNQTIRLSPNSTIQFQGRSFTTTYDLEQALNFVSKYRFDQPPVIWLDDLELWHDPEHPISRNVQRLGQHIDRNATRIFYMISAGSILYQQLQRNQEFSRHFQAVIPLNNMNQDDVYQAILIRHGATHKELVDAEGSPVEAPVFQQQANRIYRIANGNIGEALNLWAISMEAFEDNSVKQTRNNLFNIPNFIDADQALLLRTIMLEKRTTEYRLRKRFGPAFNPRYAEALLRLLSVGIIHRHLDGWLEIEECAANSITRQLQTKQYLG